MPSSGPAAADGAEGLARRRDADLDRAEQRRRPRASRVPACASPGVRSAPPRGRDASAPGASAREDGCAAKTSVPPTSTAPAPARAAPVENSAPAPSASGGPKTQVSSTALASTANARGSDSRVRTQAPTGGVAKPMPAARAIERPAARPRRAAARSRQQRRPRPSAAASRTRVCPRRSTTRPSSGPPTPRASA